MDFYDTCMNACTDYFTDIEGKYELNSEMEWSLLSVASPYRFMEIVESVTSEFEETGDEWGNPFNFMETLRLNLDSTFDLLGGNPKGIKDTQEIVLVLMDEIISSMITTLDEAKEILPDSIVMQIPSNLIVPVVSSLLLEMKNIPEAYMTNILGWSTQSPTQLLINIMDGDI